MGFQVQALRIESVKYHAIAHIVISTCRRILVRKNLLTQQAVFLLLIPQIVLQQDIFETNRPYSFTRCTPAVLAVDAPYKQLFHKNAQFFEQADRINSTGSHGGRDLIHPVGNGIKRSLLRLYKIIDGENNPLFFPVTPDGSRIIPENSWQEVTVLVQRQKMRISMLAGVSHGIIQRSADAYIPSTPSVFQTLRMSDARQRQLFPSTDNC